jgi:hypothetical protein
VSASRYGGIPLQLINEDGTVKPRYQRAIAPNGRDKSRKAKAKGHRVE